MSADLEVITKGMPAAQREALKSMAEPLVDMYVAIRDAAFAEGKSLVQSRHKIGQLINEVVGNESTYGAAAMEQLAQALDGVVSITILYECRKLASVYTEEALDKILDLRSPGQTALTYNHLVKLSQMPDKTKRNELTKRTIREGLSVSALDTAIRLLETGGTGGASTNGVPLNGLRPPKTVTAGLHQIAKLPDEVSRRVAMWKRSVFEKVEKAPPDSIDTKTLALIDATSKSVEQGVAALTEIKGRLAEARKRVNTVLSLREKNAKNAKKDAKGGKAAKAAARAKAAKAKATKRQAAAELQPA